MKEENVSTARISLKAPSSSGTSDGINDHRKAHFYERALSILPAIYNTGSEWKLWDGRHYEPVVAHDVKVHITKLITLRTCSCKQVLQPQIIVYNKACMWVKIVYIIEVKFICNAFELKIEIFDSWFVTAIVWFDDLLKNSRI